MTIRTTPLGLAAAVLLTACGGDAGHSNNSAAEQPPASLPAGEYELTTKVDELTSTDNTAPATALKAGLEATSRACVAADGTIDAKMFAEAGDTCTVTDSYVKNGRMSVQLKCTRAGKSGNVMQLVDGDFKADSFEARVLGSTGFSGDGDYNMTRSVTAKRVGDCPASS